MSGNPYRIAMLVLALVSALVAIVFAVVTMFSASPFQVNAAVAVVTWASGVAVFWFTVWLIVSAMTWRPRRDESTR